MKAAIRVADDGRMSVRLTSESNVEVEQLRRLARCFGAHAEGLDIPATCVIVAPLPAPGLERRGAAPAADDDLHGYVDGSVYVLGPCGEGCRKCGAP